MQSTGVRDQAREAGVPGLYDHGAVEARWQAAWQDDRAHATPASDERERAFVLASYPPVSERAGLGDLRAFAIADAYARVRRAKGHAVLFSLGFDCSGIASDDHADARCAVARSQLTRLGCSVDWGRAFASSEPDHRRRSQQVFLTLLERGLAYRRGGQWFLRSSAYAEENERALDTWPGWSDEAVRAQREALSPVHGFEVDAVVLGGPSLAVFTPHGESIERAAFVAVSPGHSDVGAFTADPGVAAQVEEAHEVDWLSDTNGGRRVRVVATGLQASVPGASSLLPVVISPLFDDRFGETAVLGIPEHDDGARLAAETLEAASAGLWRVAPTSAKPRAAARYRLSDVPISTSCPVGVPLPLLECARCGTEPAPLEQLPLQTRDEQDGQPGCACPRCGDPARREVHTLAPRFDEMWMWLSLCVPAEDRAAPSFGHPSHGRWLPAQQVVGGAEAGRRLLDERTIAKMLQDAGELPELAREPVESAVVHGSVRVESGKTDADTADPSELLERVGADALRLALLKAAAPGTTFTWNDEPLRHSGRFLAELWNYAEPRLRAWEPGAGRIDGSTRWRRRLMVWCRVGADKVATDVEQLKPHRATHNALLLLTRIEDFEARVLTANGELDAKDREAVVAAILVLVQVLAPFVPHIAEEMWSVAGHETLLATTPWPEVS